MFCSISGNACEEAVVSKTGHIFEKRLIETFIDQEGECPITHEPLSKDELYFIKVLDPNVPIVPRLPSATSVPSLLKSLQTSFDSSMLELHSLRVDNSKLQQELTRSLYQHDAACRVVARLLSENQQLKEELSQLKATEIPPASMSNGTPMSIDKPPVTNHTYTQRSTSPEVETNTKSAVSMSKSIELPKELVEAINICGENLSKTRKKRKSQSTATSDQILSLTLKNSVETPYSGVSLIRTVQPEPHVMTHYLVVGKTRGIAVYSFESGKLLGNLPVKQNRISHLEVLVHDAENPIFVVGKKDAVMVTRIDQLLHEIEVATLIDVSVHPSGQCFAILQPDCLTLYSQGALSLYTIPLDQPTHLQFHPDGFLMAVACQQISIYYVLNQTLAATFDAKNTELCRFSENGYHLAVLRSTEVEEKEEKENVDIWDLRKNIITTTLSMPPVTHLVFDYTGHYLACVHPSSVSIYGLVQKQWTLITSLDCPKNVSDVAWGPNAKSIWVASSESKHLQFFSIESEVQE
ncbi:hypothetical protein HMI54_007038 [Coelomomyces lativittatus]|nr:hypothetical protein HMI54_007038 [Coelomomyces lativittatus]KAJ1513761.1 hypothetical protein HMI56_001826 [Coelomomyces lativittatus]KAJ1516057.1 hypothetical protein HMI55_003071 [Coelomomyces lativittatus]